MDSSKSPSPAEYIYADYLVQRELGTGLTIEDLCAQYPTHAADLRRLDQEQREVSALVHGTQFFQRGSRAPKAVASAIARSFTVGERIGDFQLVRFIGHGGMGQVWEAQQLSLRRSVALKFLLPGRTDERTLALFEREARAGGKANHPNLVRTLARGESGGVQWIAQELVPGSYSLRDAIEDLRREAALPKDYYTRVAQLVKGIALGLQAAHDAGVVHRDLKPQNILIDDSDRPRVLDFGLARVTGDSMLSQTGDFAGTYQYMSPEQVTAKRIGLDHRTDIFSLGVVMYELLTLQRPFEGDTTQKIAEAIVMVDPPDPNRIRSQCPRDLAIICGKAMQKRPGARYPSMDALAADIERHLRHEEIHARPASAGERVRKWMLRHPAASVGLAVGSSALVMISALAIYAQSRATEAHAARDQIATQNEELTRSFVNLEQARAEALRKAEDVLSLSTQKDLDDLVASAQELWPAHPDMIPRYEAWLESARLVLHGQPAADPQTGWIKPGLEQHQARLTQLRQLARPLSPEQARKDREAHPRYAEWVEKSAALQWRARMLGMEPWPSESATTAELAQETLPESAAELNALAWSLVDPKKLVFGQEMRSVLLARRAVALADASQRGECMDTHAWALFRVGRLDEALNECRLALQETGGTALSESAAELERTIALWRPEALPARKERLEALAKELATLEAQLAERRTYEFDRNEHAWWNRQLSKLVSDLEALREPSTGLMGTALAEPFGWGIEKRLEFARSLAERSVREPQAERLWMETIEAIRQSPRYQGLRIQPQLGLQPLGMDPQSQLHEFAHLLSGQAPTRDAEGKLQLTEDTAVVLVLIPGGGFWMGAQSKDPNAPNYDPLATADESIPHWVELSPYFLSKFELTQGQWNRVVAKNPSVYGPWRYFKHWNQDNQEWSALHPVEMISWSECSTWLGRMGLQLPSEAQWEYAARSGTQTPFWTGTTSASLQAAANLADAYGKTHGNEAWSQWERELNDGSTVHRRVGSYRANDFGLHDIIGNVSEWVLDPYIENYYARSAPKDPLPEARSNSIRVFRGASFDDVANAARVSNRSNSTASARDNDLGVRPARALDP